MDDAPKFPASVEVETADGRYIVHVNENGSVQEHPFEDEDAAQSFAHDQRLRLKIIPQQDLS